MREVYQLLSRVQPTKRNVVGMSAKFYDPLGIVSPVTVQFKFNSSSIQLQLPPVTLQTVVTLSEGHIPDELLPRRETEYLDAPSVIDA